MLILNNGVPKSGSTWMQSVLRVALDPAFPSGVWRNNWLNPSVDPKKLKDYVASNEWRQKTTLVKLHVTRSDDMSYLNDPDIKVIVTYRNIPDSILSWFHHQIRMEKASLDEKVEWFDTVGVEFAHRLCNHRLSWLNEPNAHCVRYEDMLADPTTKLIETCQFLGQPISNEKVKEIVARTRVNRKGPVEGSHIRTAGKSRSEIEIPTEALEVLKRMDADLERHTSEIMAKKNTYRNRGA